MYVNRYGGLSEIACLGCFASEDVLSVLAATYCQATGRNVAPHWCPGPDSQPAGDPSPWRLPPGGPSLQRRSIVHRTRHLSQRVHTMTWQSAATATIEPD